MINYLWYIVLIFVIVSIIINYKLYKCNLFIKNIEKEALLLFNNKFLMIPGFFEISKKYISKHTDVFLETLKVFKLYSISYNDKIFFNRYYITTLLDWNFNFLFKIFNKKSKFINSNKFLYLKDIYINNNIDIWKKMIDYEKYIKKYNILVVMNNILLIGYLIPSNIKKQ